MRSYYIGETIRFEEIEFNLTIPHETSSNIAKNRVKFIHRKKKSKLVFTFDEFYDDRF